MLIQNQRWGLKLELRPEYPSPAVRAALQVLVRRRGGQLTYRQLVDDAQQLNVWTPDGDTPVNTMRRDLRTDVARSAASGVPSLFVIEDTRPVLVSLRLSEGRTTVLDEFDVDVDQILRELHRLSPRRFEELVAALLWRMGYRDVNQTPYSGDGGIDITATYPCGPISDQRFVFQVKRHGRKIGQRIVREFRGVIHDHEQGVLVALAGFHDSARTLARSWRRPIICIDGRHLARLLILHGLIPESWSDAILGLSPDLDLP